VKGRVGFREGRVRISWEATLDFVNLSNAGFRGRQRWVSLAKREGREREDRFWFPKSEFGFQE